jgi:sugar O-acyltransferase (sialic acid O-acetyltransferase NeuD family)
MIYLDNELYHPGELNIFGAGELMIQLRPHLIKAGIKLLNIYDDTLAGEEHNIEKCVQPASACWELLYCVGYKDMLGRFRRFKELKAMGFKLLSFIAENVVFSDRAHISNGTIINQGVIIDNFVNIGECSFINIGAMISHHSLIGDNVYISPGANLCGYVTVGEGVFIGANATIVDHIAIGKYAAIAAGAVVIADVPPYSMMAGNPAVIKKIAGARI